MELFLVNEGLLHIGEAIFDCLDDNELVKCRQVNKSWLVFLEKYGRKRLRLKLDLVLAKKTYDVHYQDHEQMDRVNLVFDRETFFEYHKYCERSSKLMKNLVKMLKTNKF